jgi:O-antigen ligase
VITHEIEILLFLLIALAAVGVVSKRSKIPPAILLVLTGVALALIPGLPIIRLAPELVLLLVLPPLIYSSAVAMSWKEFRFNLRRPQRIGSWGFPGPSASCWARLFRRRMPWRPCRSRAGWGCPGESSSFWKARDSRMMRQR